jgi:GT2 family glycosyltransferase
MSAPELSVVVASVNGFPYLGECLDSLERHCGEAEVIVADWTDERTRQQVRERWPRVRLLSFDEPMAVPELRAAGMFAAQAPYVALIEDHCVVREGWGDRLLAAHRNGFAVAGGPVENVVTGRVRDWAAFFCEYSAFMSPLPAGETGDLPGMNVSYDRDAIEAIDDLLREGRWESWLHARLRDRGFRFWSDPDAAIEHAKDFDFREFLSQRFHYSRSYAGMRNPALGAKRALYVLGSPLILPLVYWRTARNVLRRGRKRSELAAATPLILLYTAVWAVGEAIGYAFGGGRSLLKVR